MAAGRKTGCWLQELSSRSTGKFMQRNDGLQIKRRKTYRSEHKIELKAGFTNDLQEGSSK